MFNAIYELDGHAVALSAVISLALYVLSMFFSKRTSLLMILIGALAGTYGSIGTFAFNIGIWYAGALVTICLTALFQWTEVKLNRKQNRHLLEVTRTRWIMSIVALVFLMAASVFNLRFMRTYFVHPASGWPIICAICIGLTSQLATDSTARRGLNVMDTSFILAATLTTLFAPTVVSSLELLSVGITTREMFNHEPSGANTTTREFALSAVALPAVAFVASYVNAHFGLLISIPLILIFFGIIALIMQAYKIQKDSMRKISIMKSREEEMDEGRRKLYEMELDIIQKEKDNLLNMLDLRRSEVTGVAEKLTEQREFMQELYNLATEAESTENTEKKDILLHELLSRIDLRLNFSDERNDLNNKVEELHKDFSIRLQSKYPQLTPQERKLAALLRLEFPTKYIATVLNISPKSVEIERHRLRQKFGLDRKTKLTDFIKTI